MRLFTLLAFQIPPGAFDGLNVWGMGFAICSQLMTNQGSGLTQVLKLPKCILVHIMIGLGDMAFY